MDCMQTMDNPQPNADTPFVLAYARCAGVPPVASGLFQETPVVPVYRLERGDAFSEHRVAAGDVFGTRGYDQEHCGLIELYIGDELAVGSH